MRFYVTEKLGPKQSLTPEGYLLCEDVPVARTGQMIYGPEETPVSVGPDGIVRINRDADEVFRIETIASCQGKSVVDDHPTVDVIPSNWRQLTGGVMINPRRGKDEDQDVILADLLITDPALIAAVQDGKREVSLGYDAEYDELAPGLGRQRNIIVNHVALVERGRCGPRCAIGDQAPPQEITKMAKKSWLQRARDALRTKDAEALEDLVKEKTDDEPAERQEMAERIKEKEKEGQKESKDEIHVHLGGSDDAPPAGAGAGDPMMEERMNNLEAGMDELRNGMTGVQDAIRKLTGDEEGNKALEGNLEMEAPPGTGDKARKAKDSMYLEDSFQDTVAMAEVLCPGIRIPTFDRASNPKRTFDAICGLRRKALEMAYGQPATRGVIDDVLGGRTFDVSSSGMTCDAVRTLFRAAGAAAKSLNNRVSPRDSVTTRTTPQGIHSIADINRRNRDRYAKSSV